MTRLKRDKEVINILLFGTDNKKRLLEEYDVETIKLWNRTLTKALIEFYQEEGVDPHDEVTLDASELSESIIADTVRVFESPSVRNKVTNFLSETLSKTLLEADYDGVQQISEENLDIAIDLAMTEYALRRALGNKKKPVNMILEFVAEYFLI